MRPAQLLLSAERRHTLPAPPLFGNQPAPLRPCISVSFSLRHRATLLCDDLLPQDAVHVALTFFQYRVLEIDFHMSTNLNGFVVERGRILHDFAHRGLNRLWLNRLGNLLPTYRRC